MKRMNEKGKSNNGNAKTQNARIQRVSATLLCGAKRDDSRRIIAYSESHKAEKSEYDKQRFTEKRDEIKAKQTEYRKKNAERLNEKEKLRYAEKREEILAKASIRNKNNREKENARIRRWCKENPKLAQAMRARRKARLRGATINDLTAEQWEQIKAEHSYQCAYCGVKPEKLTQDHVIPLSKGGNHTATNIVPACLSCNCKKGAKIYV